MRKFIATEPVTGEGLESLSGGQVILFCGNYFYAGILEGVNNDFVKLRNPRIVYETGSFTAPAWRDAQDMGVEFAYVRIPAIEAFARGK
jgi:hypothetical protein